jgi:fructose-1,6-bisphosphatase/sedoheptulose 1,7-bisphosphatase-like protein
VVEQAAIACAPTMGRGDRDGSDQAAVEAMRRTLEDVAIDGTIVIGEASATKRRCCTSASASGRGAKGARRTPQVDIAVDPLEGTNLCATGAPNAIAVLAASTRGGLLHAPDLYMEKLVVGPARQAGGQPRSPGQAEPEVHRQSARSQGRRPGGAWCWSASVTKKLIADIRPRVRAFA